MSLTGPDWVKLNRLLDQALDLEPAQRSQWMDALPQEYEALRATLRDLLLRNSGIETSEVLRRAPSFPIDSVAPVSAGMLIGPYRLLREIGSGGMASVWLAERADGSLQRRVALKLPRVYTLDRDLPERLGRERDILASLEHPGIARLYDAGVAEGGRPYLGLEFVDGLPLDVYVARHALSIRKRLALFEQVARAVAYAHARLIVHRDLKPSNILVRESGDVLLLDFGIARLLLPDSNPQWAARAFTPRYAAPEQFAGELPTVATDIYSLGIILFELLVGRTPYEIRDDVICLQPVPVVQAVEKSRAREIGRDLAAIVAKAIEVRAQDRYATISEFLEDLTRCRRHQTVKAMPDSSWYRARKFVRRYQTVVSLAAALLIAIVVGAGLSVQQAKLAVRERDRAVQMLEQSAATNEFWNTVLAEGVANDEVVSMQDLLERSELIAERAAASSPLQYAVAIDSIASLYLSYGLPAKAETLIARTLEQYQGIEEGKHVMCHLRCEYALAIGTLGRMEEADTLFSQVLQGVENEPSVKQYCLQSRAAVAGENFDVANALNYIEEAYQLQLQSPIRSPWVLAQLDGELAYAYVLNGKSDLAQERYDSAWKVFEAIGREESHVAMGVLNGWGILAMGTGDPAEALKIFDRAIEIARKRLPAGHPPPDLLFNQAMALAALGRYDEAVRQFDRLRKRALADDNENMAAGAVAGAADAYLQAGDFAGAEQLINGLTESERATLAPDSARMLRLAVVNARLLAKQQKYDAADKVLTQVLASFERKGAIIRRRVIAMTFHADLLLAMGRTDAAAVEARRALEMAQLTRGKKLYSDLVGLARSAQGKVQLAQGERAAAVESLQAAIEDLKFTLGAEHPDTQAAQALIASMPMT